MKGKYTPYIDAHAVIKEMSAKLGRTLILIKIGETFSVFRGEKVKCPLEQLYTVYDPVLKKNLFKPARLEALPKKTREFYRKQLLEKSGKKHR